MLVEIPDAIIEEVQVLNRLGTGRLGDFTKVEQRIDISRYHVSEMVFAAIMKSTTSKFLPYKK